MLERATACLKAGARDSLKCAQHAKAQVPHTASRRRLHSTFWTHGAGDIDFDISLVGAAGAGLPWQHDDIQSSRPAGKRKGKEQAAAVSSTPASSPSASSSSEVPFLDFLYPPQALAWLHKSNGQPWERWERRNARRLPEGFVQASRGYSSRSHVRSAEAKSQDGSLSSDTPALVPADLANNGGEDTPAGLGNEDDLEDAGQPAEDEPSPDIADPLESSLDSADVAEFPPLDSAASTEGEHLQDDSAFGTSTDEVQDLDKEQAGSTPKVTTHTTVQLVREMAPSVQPGKNEDAANDAADEYDESSDALTAISPGDLAEGAAADFEHVANPLEALRSIMRARRKLLTVQDISRAWFLYTSLNETDKLDYQLMHELLLWFTRVDMDTAHAHSISLFWSIPVASRTLADYEAVLTAFLKRKTQDAVAGVHKEALRNIANGHQITKRLFRYAVDHDNWQLALAVKEDHDCAFEDDGPTQARQKAMFWINVSEIENLTTKAEALVHKCQWFIRRGRSDVDKFTAFSARMSEEAFRQKLLAPWETQPSLKHEQRHVRAQLKTILDSIRLWSPEAPQLFEEFLVKLLDLNRTEEQYREAHDIVSYVYGWYRKLPDVRPSEQLLESLLKRVLPYAIHLRSLQTSRNSVTIEVIVEDWQTHHTKLNCWAVKRLMSWYARQGMPGPLDEYYTYLRRHYPSYKDQADVLWTLIYVHARRAEPEKAQQAFHQVDRIARLNEERPDLKCWNILMHAHARADDLVGGLDTFSLIIDGAKLLPDNQTLHPLLEMLARRGDADGIADLLMQYDTLTDALHTTSLVGSRMRALINCGEVSEAEHVLKKAVQQVRDHEVTGSLTGCFNIMLSAHAQRRDIDATMRTYRWMKADNIRLDRYTFTCLMLALIRFRQTPAAYTIMTEVMPREGFIPTAIHYAIVMTGLIDQGVYSRAIWVHEKMQRKNIRPSLATRKMYLTALAMKERAEGKSYDPDGEPVPLTQVINELRDALAEHDGSEIASKDPVFSHDPTSGGEDVREHFVTAIFVHGRHRCFQAVHELFRMYNDESAKFGKANATMPMRILVAMMNTHLHSRDYQQVEAYWKLAKDNADLIAPTIAVPDYRRLRLSAPEAVSSIAQPNQENFPVPERNEIDRAEIGFEANQATSVQGIQTLLPASLPRMGPRPAPAKKFILTRPLRYHLRALAAQNRIADVLTTFTALVRQGYAFDSITWNRLIEYLCNATPPLALLAFTLTERYLIAKFPGWTPRYMTRRPARRSAVREGLQFIRGRYMSYDALVPQYRTMVFLTAALLKLRRMEATGAAKVKGEIGRFVGTVRQIESAAPRTLDAVNSMPQIEHDKLQHELLRSDKANEL